MSDPAPLGSGADDADRPVPAPPRRPASRFLTCLIVAAGLFALALVGALALALAVAVGLFPHD